ncbi:50S ribosomal protein L6 [Patescibacteria group bacterium]|nr:50S ribosomal protein L6 [Patescibacteria group bacterium]MBU0776806.1 50S ribosomal protein L6 [Patescibacteria group bacterium]MBU0845619.1 50S ribosomal protein L6 [Patescibacteria group bacterium]MBU0922661.1 50S ribosomal protein L6 [Patescibacteria group bacterium]MBU1066712.1 50S ribosomal protein L6 [Patescibacteria group bacterium]
MSRIGKLPVILPETVEISVSDGVVSIKGPKGELKRKLPREIKIEVGSKEILIRPKGDSKTARAMHGTWRALIANMVKGVSEGWSKQLELVGTGYRAEGSESNLVLAIGYSHPVEMKAPEGISFTIQKTIITVEGADKELVGQVAAKIRDIRPPEPYKGKGIKYIDEVVRRKPGKAAKAQGAAA